MKWVWQHQKWPNLSWNEAVIAEALLSSRALQGQLMGIIHVINTDAADELSLSVLTDEAIDTSAILALAQDEQSGVRYYSMSSAIMKNRKAYYSELAKVCQGDWDITQWLLWFIGCFNQAVQSALDLVDAITLKSQFWQQHAKTALSPKQIKVLNKLLDKGGEGFEGGMTTRKYMAITRVSRATAYRDLADLVDKGCLRMRGGQGRSVAYEVVW